MKRTMLLALLGAALTPSVRGDEVLLVGGGRLSGVIVERTATTIVLETAPGRVGVPLARVARIVAGSSALDEYRMRRQALAPDDVAGWLALAQWSQAHGLATQARTAFEQVVRLDPSQAAAQAALGHEQVGERWLTSAEAQRARGLMEFEGLWVTPAERQQLIEERAVSAREAREQAESEARVREADARARAAEAEARRAEAEAQAAQEAATRVSLPVVLTDSGPFDPLGQGGAGVCGVTPCASTHVHDGHCEHGPRPRTDAPAASPQPGGTGMVAPQRRPRREAPQDRPRQR